MSAGLPGPVPAAAQGVPLGGWIARYRRRRGLSQVVVAGLIGRSESWLSQVERGVRTVDRLSVLQELSRVLGVDLAELTTPPAPTTLPAQVSPARAPRPAVRGAAQPVPDPALLARLVQRIEHLEVALGLATPTGGTHPPHPPVTLSDRIR